MARPAAMSVPVGYGLVLSAMLLSLEVLGAVPALAGVHEAHQTGIDARAAQVCNGTGARSSVFLPRPPAAWRLAAGDHPEGRPGRKAWESGPHDSQFHRQGSLADEPQEAGVLWEALSAQQRELLAEYQASWEQLPADRRRALLRSAQRWLALPPARREEAQRRFEYWQALDPQQRRELRHRYQQFKMLPEQEQERIRRGFQDFQHLTPEQRREMRKRFRESIPKDEPRSYEPGCRPADHGGFCQHFAQR